jgi:hypothetical protein
MCSVQLEEAKLVLRKTGSVGELTKHVAKVLEGRGLVPKENMGLWRGMVNRVIVNYNYDLEEQEYLGYN